MFLCYRPLASPCRPLPVCEAMRRHDPAGPTAWGRPQVLEEQLGRRGDAVAPLRPVLLRTLADVQQRLTFRVQAFIKARGPAREQGSAVLARGASAACRVRASL